MDYIKAFLSQKIDLTKEYTADDFVFFFEARRLKRVNENCFSQWWKADFTDEDGMTFCCNEQYMMYQKAKLFHDTEYMKLIMESTDPKTIKDYGRKVRGFDSAVWNQHNREIVGKANYLKFSQNPELKEFLLGTGDKILVEASPYDGIWGIKMKKGDAGITDPNNWKGTNYLGFAIMDAREKIRQYK